jgi:D-alanyl-D-alanine carboxypeptidase
MVTRMHSKLLLLMSLPIAVASCSRDTRPLDMQIKEVLIDRLGQYDVKGASTSVILPDGSIHRIAAGLSHDTVSMHPDMLFAIGSITKNVVATLIFQLAEEGLLSLEDPLYKWLPSYPKIDSTITIRQLLAHTSGIFMFWGNQKLWDDLIKYRDSVFTPEVVLTYLKDPHFAPGKGFRYSNTNYLLLAMIATRATRSPLSAEFRKRFWQPYGLKDTYLSMEDLIPQERLAHVWGDNFENDGSNRDITYLPRASHESITYGSSGIFTTAGDLARWCKVLFTGKVLKRSSLEQMLDFQHEGYGLGVHLISKSITNGEKAFGHGGGNIGSSAYMVYLPGCDVSIVVMINSFHGKCLDRMLEDIIKCVTEHPEQRREQ